MFAAALLLSGVTVTLGPEAHVSGTEMTVGEIAEVAGEVAEDVSRVEAVELGYAPMPGYSRLLHAVRIGQIVQRETGLAVTVAGDRACRVWPLAREVSREGLADAAREELARLAEGLDAELELVRAPAAVRVPAGAEGVTLDSRLADRELRSGRISVPVRIHVDGVLYRTAWTTWDVAIYETRTVLRREVRAGEQLLPDHFESRRVRVSEPGADNPAARYGVVGAVAARDLGADRTVTALDVKRPIAVRRGDTVYLQARKGSVVARVPAVARQDGAVGDRVLVETLSRGRELSGRVLSGDMVEIDLGGSR